MILEVRIKAPPGGTNRTLRFTKSPIRIGRNQLNDISLDDPFVSEWHGTIRFDLGSVAYFDLGSTNGTELDGKRLAKNVPMELTDASRLRLGLLELSVVRPAAEAETAPRQPHGSGLFQTLAWGQLAPNLAALDAAKARQQPVNISGGALSERTGGVPASPATGPVTPPPRDHREQREQDGREGARALREVAGRVRRILHRPSQGLRAVWEGSGRENDQRRDPASSNGNP